MAQAGLDVSGETDGGDGTDLPAFVPLVKVGKALYEGDSIQYVELNPLAVYPQLVFKNDKQRQAYNRLVANVKKVLPIAKEVNHIIIETYDFLQTLPNKKAKDEHLKRVERGIRAEYTPRMKKLTSRKVWPKGRHTLDVIAARCGYDLTQHHHALADAEACAAIALEIL